MVLKFLVGAPLFAGTIGLAPAAPAGKIVGLIEQARAQPTLSQRIDVISRALIGTPYVAHTLIGGPRRKEVLVVRADAFDCVTYCEFVLAAAMARDVAEFETALRKIRYRNGEIEWRARNHYFADWCRNNIDNGICRFVALGEPITIKKSSDAEPGLGRRSWSLDVIALATLLSSAAKLTVGDVVGFVSRRANLDYSHTGFVVFGGKGELLLRHASSIRHRVVDQPIAQFLAANHVEYVTVLRPIKPT